MRTTASGGEHGTQRHTMSLVSTLRPATTTYAASPRPEALLAGRPRRHPRNVHRGPTVLVCTLLLVGCGASARTSAARPRAAEWRHDGPRDHDAIPPDSPATSITERALAQLPPMLAEAYRRMHALGYPSLEGAEFREVEIEADRVGGSPQITRLRAFVLRSDDGAPWAFVDGTWHPVIALGGTADLVRTCESGSRPVRPTRAESDLIISSDGEVLGDRDPIRAAWENPRPFGLTRLKFRAPHLAALESVEARRTERDAAACPSLAAILPLAHQGQLELAGRLRVAHQHRDAVLASMVVEWAMLLVRRVSLDFHRGHDASAVRHADSLRPVLEAVESLGWEHPFSVQALMSDLERRRSDSTPQRALPSDAAEAGSLIAALEDVAIYQPATVSSWRDGPRSELLRESSVVQALVDLGPGAVDGLLECALHDTRLSRSVRGGYGLRFGGLWGEVSVSELCDLALEPRFLEPRSRLLGWFDAATMARDRAQFEGWSDAEVVFSLFTDESYETPWVVLDWMLDDPDDEGPQPMNLELLRPLDDGRMDSLLAGRAEAVVLADADAVHGDEHCKLVLLALAWSAAAAVWVVDDAQACISDGCWCAEDVERALLARRPDLVGRSPQ